MDHKEQIELLKNHTIKVFTIKCDKCHKRDFASIDTLEDSNDGAEYFYREGWTYFSGKCLCPNCVKDIWGNNIIYRRILETNTKKGTQNENN